MRQPSRLKGHSLADLLALSTISVLVDIVGSLKFEAAARLLRGRPEEVELRIETEGPRMGVWSVTQPRWITQVRRVGQWNVRHGSRS